MDSKLTVLLKHIPANMHEVYARHLNIRKRKGHLPQIGKLYMEMAKSNFEAIDSIWLAKKLKTTNLPTLMSKLYKDVETFCIQKLYEGTPEAAFPELVRLKFYGEIRMWNVYKVLRQRFIKYTLVNNIYFPEDTYILYRFFKLDAINAKYYDGRKDNGELLLPIKYLNLFYQFENVKMQVELGFRNDIVNAHYTNMLIDLPDEPPTIAVQLLFNIYKLIQCNYQSVEADYPKLLQQFNLLTFSATRHGESIKTIVHFLINLCIKGINRGHVEFCLEYMYLIDFLIAHELLLEKGKVEISKYKNALAAATKAGKPEWANNFGQKFGTMLDVPYGKEMMNYYLASHAFDNKDFKAADKLLPLKIADWYNEPFLQLSIIRLRIKLLIENYGLNRWEELETQLRLMRNFLKKASVGKETKLKYLGFASVLEKLMCQKISNIDEIKNKEAILDREWLLLKIEQLQKSGR